jgi:methyl-accepting chemotaxis protein
MNSKWTIGKKLIASFLSVAVVTAVLGIVGYYGVNQGGKAISELGGVRLPSIESTLAIRAEAENIRGTLRTLAISGLPTEMRQRQYDNLARAQEAYQQAWAVYEPLPQTPEEAEVWKKLVPAWNAWRAENTKAVELARQFDAIGVQRPYTLKENLETYRGDHYRLEMQVLEMIQSKEIFAGGESHTDCNFGRWMGSFQTDNPAIRQAMQTCAEPHRRFHEAIRQAKQLVQEGKIEEAQRLYETQMAPAAEKTFAALYDMRGVADQALAVLLAAEQQVLGPVTDAQRAAMDLLNQVVAINSEVGAEVAQQSQTQAAFLKVLAVVALAIGVVLALGLGIVISRSINKVLTRIVEALSEGSEQVAAASGQVSAASQSLAEGATEQAAGLEETSSSLEEMSSMTKQNADNAQQANTLASEARKAADTGAESMTRMSRAINDIQKSSDETAKIIKVIDEIAFQTNLLALNAAVEAARAGEAGKGFAVVAEEVRNLAMRSAEAAKNTASMIEESVKNARNGVDIAAEVGKVLDEIVQSIGKTTNLVGEIAAASQEQAQGIDQVNTSVSQMDKVTQQNAANAEESASASEELSNQAESMNEIVGELIALVGGAAAKNTNCRDSRPARRTVPKQAKARPLRPSDGTWHKIAAGKANRQTIPLGPENADLNEFNT